MTPFENLHRVASAIQLPEPYVLVCGEAPEFMYLRIRAMTQDNHDPDNQVTWNGRKWPISRHSTDGEIVQTAFLALMTAIEHEARERFTYKGVSVFDPHYDIDKLVALRQSPGGGLKERDNG